MKRRLQDLSKKEWDTLFPIALVDHDPNWKGIFEDEKKRIIEKIESRIIRIEHVGSTYIPDIKAKGYIDVLIEIVKGDVFSEEIIEALASLNYHFFRPIGKDADYMIFVKGYHLNGEKEQVFHVHMCPSGHEMLNQIAFRNYLLVNRQRALEYEKLKLFLSVKHKNDRSGYRIAKTDFIAETMCTIRSLSHRKNM